MSEPIDNPALEYELNRHLFHHHLLQTNLRAELLAGLTANALAVPLQSVGFKDVAKAVRLIIDLAGNGVSDEDVTELLPTLFSELHQCPDPDQALLAFSRWFSAVGNRLTYIKLLRFHYQSLHVFCQVAGASQYLADIIIKYPDSFEVVVNPGVRGGVKSAVRLYREVSETLRTCQNLELKKNALRTWKARELLRIGVRDISCLADVSSTAREFSHLADACVQAALDISLLANPLRELSQDSTASTLPFAVIAMGKLGGRELNYCSDIDLMFAYGDELPADVVTAEGRTMASVDYLDRVARTMLKALTDETRSGSVFRVDLRLRPEGRFGALVRSLDGFRNYYTNWSQSWEKQALIKARFIAGDRLLGDVFEQMVASFIFSRSEDPTVTSDLHDNKRRMEQKCEADGQTETNIKTGFGGIRDVEFIVQSIQLEHGGRSAYLRVGNTLSAIQRLHHSRYLATQDAYALSKDYRFLRNLEHRLQLDRGFQTQLVPKRESYHEWDQLARRMGYGDRAQFVRDLETTRDRVHAILDRLFYERSTTQASGTHDGPPQRELEAKAAGISGLLATITRKTSRARLANILSGAGIRDTEAALRILESATASDRGTEIKVTESSFAAILPTLLTSLKHSADPDAGLSGFELLSQAAPSRVDFFASFLERPVSLDKLICFAAASPPLTRVLARHPDWLAFITQEPSRHNDVATLPPSIVDPRERERVLANMHYGISFAKSNEERILAITNVYQRELVGLAALDIWKTVDLAIVMSVLTAIAEATIRSIFFLSRDAVVKESQDSLFAELMLNKIAIIGMGKLGAGELSYASDLDLVFVYDDASVTHHDSANFSGSVAFEVVNSFVEKFIRFAAQLPSHGADVQIDLRLRPWGRKGALIHSIRGFINYFRTSGETWERQATLKARYIAGNERVGNRFVRVLHAISYGRGITETEMAEIRSMKERIERERLDASHQKTDIKLGNGGIIDIEWIVQSFQLLYGDRRITLRNSNTLGALSALASARLIDNAEAEMLSQNYRLLLAVRNALWINSGADRSLVPIDPVTRRAISIILGYESVNADPSTHTDDSELFRIIEQNMQVTRSVFQRRFLSR